MLRADIKPIVDGEAAHRAASPSISVLTYLRIAITAQFFQSAESGFEAILQQGIDAVGAGKHIEAVDAFDQAIALRPNHFSAPCWTRLYALSSRSLR